MHCTSDAATSQSIEQASGHLCMALHVRIVALQLSDALFIYCPGCAATPPRTLEPRLSPNSWLRSSRVRHVAACT
jgi:hypothetical protein